MRTTMALKAVDNTPTHSIPKHTTQPLCIASTHHRFPALGAEAYNPEACSTDLGREVIHRHVRRRTDEHLQPFAHEKKNTIHVTGAHSRKPDNPLVTFL